MALRQTRAGGQCLFFLEPVIRDALLIAVILIGQEFAGHGDLHAIALGVRLAFEIEIEIKVLIEFAAALRAFAAKLLQRRLEPSLLDSQRTKSPLVDVQN